MFQVDETSYSFEFDELFGVDHVAASHYNYML